MNTFRHIAGIPSKDEQRCVRCCEVIVSRKAVGLVNNFCAFPGSAAVVIAGRLFADHPTAVDCEAVDLSKREPVEVAP